MPFTIPNRPDAAFEAQSGPDKVDFDILAAGTAGTGVETDSDCEVTAQVAPDMTVAVASGTVHFLGTVATVTGDDVTVTAADPTDPRFDLIVATIFEGAGTPDIVTGTPAQNPVFPALPADAVPLAAVYVPAGDTAINSNQIVDKRVVVTFPIDANEVVVIPAGTIASTNLQDALEELDAEKQPLDTELTALSSTTSAADKGIHYTGSGTAATHDLTSYSRTLLALASKISWRNELDIGPVERLYELQDGLIYLEDFHGTGVTTGTIGSRANDSWTVSTNGTGALTAPTTYPNLAYGRRTSTVSAVGDIVNVYYGTLTRFEGASLEMVILWLVKKDDANGSEQSLLRVGAHDMSGAAVSPTDGFELILPGTGSNWLARVWDGGVAAAGTDTGVAHDTDWTWLGIIVDGLGAAHFYINDLTTPALTLTDGVDGVGFPDAGDQYTLNYTHRKTVNSAAHTAQFDAVALWIPRT